MSRKRGLAISYFFTILNTVIGLFTSAFTIQMVGQTDYGIYQAIGAFASYLVLFELGTGNVLNRNISLLKKDGSEQAFIDKNISTIWSIAMLLSLLITAVSVGFYFSLDRLYQNSMTPEQIALGKLLFIPTIIKLVVSFWTQTLNGGFIGFEHYSAPKTIALIHLLIRTAVVVVFLYLYKSIMLMVMLDAVLEIAMFAVTYLYGKWKLHIKLTVRKFDKGVFMVSMPLALALLFQSIINMANNSVDKFVISVMMPPENVAVYSVAMLVFVTFSSLVSLPTTIYMPEVARNIRNGLTGSALTETLVQSCRLVVVIGGMIVGGFIVVGRQFIEIMYGPDYMEAWVAAIVIMIPMLISTTDGIVVNVLDVLNKRLIRSVILLGVAAVNIALTIWLVQYWGMVGAAIATGIASLIGAVITGVYYTKALKLRIIYLFARSYKGILPCLLTAIVLALAVTRFINGIWVEFLAGGSVFVIAFGAAYILFSASKEEKEKITAFKNRLLRK